ncbi:hypothetical protein LCGC14_1709340 [marine sediment metagenome]|uniref:Uncharacterized protein n=1 Tax=marine sediment metagenome TaxID=412755 RepID=A0A0F9KFQ5_9ZZZZ
MSLHGVLAAIEATRIKRPYIRRKPRKPSPTREHVKRLVATNKMESNTCIAKIVGVTPERVRQILANEGLVVSARLQRLEWPCPRCGNPVRCTQATLYRRGVLCGRCSAGRHRGQFRTYRQCSVPVCDRLHQVKGYCGAHYARVLKGQPLDTPIAVYAHAQQGCQVLHCKETKHYARGYCRNHYAEWLRRRSLSGDLPIGAFDEHA